jgi:hypothetical protein
MTMSNHNKKRNVGIIYEQLLLRASEALIDNDVNTAKKCASIIKKHYRPGTEIFKEFRLFQALLNTTVKTESLGLRLIAEARRGSQITSTFHLNNEKSNLIRDINKTLNDDNFFNRPIKEYRLYATIQTLLNDWRNDDTSDLGKVVDYESKLLEWMKSEKNSQQTLTELKSEDINNLTVKIMREKFEKKWEGKLSDTQRSLIRDFVNGDIDKSTLDSIKNRVVRGLNKLKESSRSDVLLEKVDAVKKNVISTSSEVLDETSISKFMQLTSLYEELESKDE